MTTPSDLSPPEVLNTHYRRINNLVLHIYKNDQYSIFTLSTDERPSPPVRDVLYQFCCHAKDITSIGAESEYQEENIWKLTLLRISRNEFLVKFRPTVYKVEESDEEYDGEMD